MKRRSWLAFLLGALVCFAAFAVTGCTGKSGGNENTESEWSDENVDESGWV